MSAFCTNCGRDVSEGARHCGACGAPLPAGAPASTEAFTSSSDPTGDPTPTSRWSTGGDPARHAVPLDGGPSHRPAFDPRGLRLLGSWTEGIIWVLVLVQLPGLYFAMRQRTLLSELEADGSFLTALAFEDAENAWLGVNLVAILLLGVSTVLMMVWMFRTYGQATSLGAQDFRLGRGFTIGAWFIPIANLVMVPMILADLDKVMRAGRVPIGRTWRDLTASALVWVYGIGLFASYVASNLADGSSLDAFSSFGDVNGVITGRLFSNLLIGLTAVALATLVRRVRRNADHTASLATPAPLPA